MSHPGLHNTVTSTWARGGQECKHILKFDLLVGIILMNYNIFLF